MQTPDMTPTGRRLLAVFGASLMAGCATVPNSTDVGEQSALRAPPGFYQAAGRASRTVKCAEIPTPYTETLDFPSKFEGSDSARDDLNKEAEQRYRAQTADIKALERGVSKSVDRYMDSGQAGFAQCAMTWLHAWAEADALLGPATTHTGKSIRKWALGSVSAAYLRLKLSASRPLDSAGTQPERIEAWLRRCADSVQQEWSIEPPEKLNNHEYWAAWSVMATAVALDDRELFAWSLDIYHAAMKQIDDDGFLENELARDSRALFYHNYALPPLAMIAAFGEANGLNLLAAERRALGRLSDNVVAGINNPERFESATGTKQVPEVMKDSKFTWLEPYCSVADCTGAKAAKLRRARPLKNYRVGGNITALFKPSS